jgi:hypothetical protein
LNTSTQGNETDDIVVTEKVKTFIGKLGLYFRKIEGKVRTYFSRLKNIVKENSVEKLALELISVSKIRWLIYSPGYLRIFQKQ